MENEGHVEDYKLTIFDIWCKLLATTSIYIGKSRLMYMRVERY